VAELFSAPAVALFLYALLPANVLLYGVNDIFDAPLDALNPKKDDREVRYVGDRLVPGAVVASALVGVLLLAVLPAPSRPWVAGFLVLALAYSAPPVRFKTKPVLDSLSNGLYILLGVAAFTALAGSPPPGLAILGGWLWTMAMHTFSAIPDIAPDRAAGIHTTATVLGAGRTLAYCGLLWLGAAIAFGRVTPALGLPLVAYPLLVVAIVVRRTPIERAYWWFPAVNAGVGMLLTWGGLWRFVS
jgi:4-hydroxybenzoate polyprenyltransferase